MQPRGTKFTVLRAEQKDCVYLLGNKSARCADQAHSWAEELYYISQGAQFRVLAFTFPVKVRRSRRKRPWVLHICYPHKKTLQKLLHATFGSIFALSLHDLMWKINELPLILYIEVLWICNCSIGMHSHFLETGKDNSTAVRSAVQLIQRWLLNH